MKVMVTGGGGFLGGHIVRQLRERGDEVLVVARNTYPEVEALGARSVRHDLSQPGLERHLEGVEILFHVAARAGVWGPREAYVQANIVATDNVIAAARSAGVPRLVYTSSPSVAFRGGDDEGKSEEQLGYSNRHLYWYGETKAEAERHVLAANGADLATCALRPHLIYGPREPHMLPRVIERHKAGRLAIIGDGRNRIGLTAVENAAAAHLQAAEALAYGSAAGKAAFITDPEPVLFWDWLNAFFAGVGLPPLTRKVSRGLAEAASGLLEGAWRLVGAESEPPMTRFAASYLGTSHWYDLTRARTEFGYSPVVDADEAFRRTIEDFRDRA